jgi:hypothetical protein
MRPYFAIAGLLVASVASVAPAAAQAQPSPDTLKYAINRNGDQIGTHTIEVKRNGPEVLVSLATRIEVKVAFITAYRFEQSGSERWIDGRLVALKATTDDNGTPHKVEVAPKGSGMAVEADGKTVQADAGVFPFTLWNASLVKQSSVLDIQKGTIMKITVTDGGVDNVVVQGKRTKAHRYAVKGAFTQDIWYDDKGNLVQSMVVGPDGSKIYYNLQ